MVGSDCHYAGLKECPQEYKSLIYLRAVHRNSKGDFGTVERSLLGDSEVPAVCAVYQRQEFYRPRCRPPMVSSQLTII